MTENSTCFAPAARAPKEQVDRQAEAMRAIALLSEVLSTVPDLVLVLNPERQVVFANRALAELVHRTQDDIVGHRHGEIIGCVNSCNDTGGCGTSEACRTCGILSAILAAAEGQDAELEARLSLKSGDSLDLRVKSSRITVDGEYRTIVTLTDIADEKRRRVLERVFFHDVLNTAGGVQGLAGLIREADDGQTDMLFEMLESGAAQLVDEIQAQRLLTSVEGGEYRASIEPHAVARLVSDAVGLYVAMGRAANVVVEVASELPDVVIKTDRTMVVRVLGNLVKNAVEASSSGMTVRAGARLTAGEVEFWVNNQAVIPRDAQLQIFQRSFSTKGSGRGLGTYSVKLFTEQYLGGQVSFESLPDAGTTFRVALPLYGP
jgi:signal transduction histidine kinase